MNCVFLQVKFSCNILFRKRDFICFFLCKIHCARCSVLLCVVRATLQWFGCDIIAWGSKDSRLLCKIHFLHFKIVVNKIPIQNWVLRQCFQYLDHCSSDPTSFPLWACPPHKLSGTSCALVLSTEPFSKHVSQIAQLLLESGSLCFKSYPPWDYVFLSW